jgi:hypothetical protein
MMITPGAAATAGFLAVVGWVCVAVVWAAWVVGGRQWAVRAAVGVGLVLAVSAGLAEGGVVRRLAESRAILLFLWTWLGVAVGVAFSRAGARVVGAVPVAALVGFQAFRLPLELVLHRFYDEGVIPVQMTYSGANFDIVTGVLAVVCGLGLWRGEAGRWAVWAFNFVGLGLLGAVVRIAVLSAPTPMRVYMNDPPVQLIFHAPYTWILSVCVAGALLGHLLVFRWLWRGR